MKVQSTFRASVLVFVSLWIIGCQESSAKKPIVSDTAGQTVQASVPADSVQPKNAEPAQPTRDPNEPAPAIKIEASEHDFGKIGPDSRNSCKFQFSNAGKATLKIAHIDSTCGCTVPELAKREYAPGESGTVDVSFHAPSVAGPTSKQLYILSNDPVVPRAELVIKAVVELKIKFEPQRLNLLLNKENAALEPIKITSLDGKPFAITSFTATNNAITAQFDPKAQAAEQLIQLKAQTDALKAMTEGIIQIGLSHPENPQVFVPFTVLPMYEISRPRIILSDAVAGQPQVKEVLIKSNYGEPIEVESVKSEKGYMQVVGQSADGANLKLQVQITPPAQRYFTDEMTISLKNGQKLSIRASGWQRAGTKGSFRPVG